MRVMIVDDHEVVREGLIATLASIEYLTVMSAVSTGSAALSLARREAPDVALVDWALPDMTGQELCRELLAISASTSVVILSSYLSEDTVRDSLMAGACAYVTKSAGVPKLREVLEELHADPHKRIPVHSAPQLVSELDHLEAERHGVSRITPRQERIIELAAGGLTNRAIAEQLFISEATVRFHIQKAKERIGARTRAELVAKAIRLGLIPPSRDDVAPTHPR
jgi:DNA-binding NarL/FixJ family response regulator